MQKNLHVDENLTLELPTLQDTENLFSLVDANREHLRKFLAWVDKTIAVEQSSKNIQDRIDGYANGDTASFVIKYDKRIIGSAGYVKLNTIYKNGEIGYWISREFEGKGIMSKCVKSLIEYGFGELKLHRITIRCNSNNSKSVAIPKRFGFTHEGTIREDHFDGEVYSNTELFGLLSGEYK